MAKKDTVKCVLVGDGAVGKMTMVDTYVSGEFPKERRPYTFENREKGVTFGDEQVTLGLCIPCGLEGYERHRPQHYTEADIFMVCFSLVFRDSMRNVCPKWIPEIRENCGRKVPVMLVGMKMDLRADEEEVRRMGEKGRQEPVTTAEGEKLASKVGAVCYMECSAKTGENLRETMGRAVGLGLAPEPDKTRCVLM